MSDPERYQSFLEKYPQYAQTSAIDALRAKDYARLDRLGQIYLDYTGGGLYADSQIAQHMHLLFNKVLGNPHSSNPTSLAATEIVEQARAYVLDFFHADPAEYDVIFTQNASGALKLVGESYPFDANSRYLVLFDNHNSVQGIREFARARGAEVSYMPVVLPNLRLPDEALRAALNTPNPRGHNLFAYPAQSNFSGVQHDLGWIQYAQARGWDVLLDAAAFIPTNRLDLSQVKPDFVTMSFYKIFGYPTGIGALVARKQALSKLRRPWFAGGTITVVSVREERHYLARGHAAFEEGTVNYLGIPAVEIGLRHIVSIGYETIHGRVTALTGWLLEEMSALRHSNGAPLAKIYGPVNTHMRGGTISFNFYTADGDPVPHEAVEKAANAVNISLRTGCFCNPGAGEVALQLSSPELQACFSQPGHEEQLSITEFRNCFDKKASGAVRISAGLVSNFDDIEAFLDFAHSFLE